MLLTQLDMPAARYVCFANEGFISYRIDVRKANGNISGSSKARTYRVNEVDISTEEKREQEYKEKILIFLLSFCFGQSYGSSKPPYGGLQ